MNQITEYDPIEAGLAECRNRYGALAFDLRTVAGNSQARTARKELVTLRTTLEGKRKELKAPVLAQAKLIDDEAKRITGELLQLETPIDEMIQADEARRAAEREAKAEVERQRIAEIRARIERFNQSAAACLRSRDSSKIEAELAELVSVDIGDEFAELTPEASSAREAAVAIVREHLDALRASEAEAERLRIEREEAAAQRVEQERVAREAREAEESRLRAEREELERHRAEQEAELRAAREKAEREESARKAAADAERAEIAKAAEDLASRQREQEWREAAAAAVAAATPKRAEPSTANRPTDDEIIEVLVLHFRVHEMIVIGWLGDMDLDAAGNREVAELEGAKL